MGQDEASAMKKVYICFFLSHWCDLKGVNSHVLRHPLLLEMIQRWRCLKLKLTVCAWWSQFNLIHKEDRDNDLMENPFVVRMMLWELLPQQREQEELSEGQSPHLGHQCSQILRGVGCTRCGGPARGGDLGCRKAGALWALVEAASSLRRRCPARNDATPEESWSCGAQPGEDGGEQSRGWGNSSDVSHLLWLLVPTNLSNVLVNQIINQNRGFSGAFKISSKVLFAWPWELKKWGSHCALKWFYRTPFSMMSHQLIKIFESTEWAETKLWQLEKCSLGNGKKVVAKAQSILLLKGFCVGYKYNDGMKGGSWMSHSRTIFLFPRWTWLHE